MRNHANSAGSSPTTPDPLWQPGPCGQNGAAELPLWCTMDLILRNWIIHAFLLITPIYSFLFTLHFIILTFIAPFLHTLELSRIINNFHAHVLTLFNPLLHAHSDFVALKQQFRKIFISPSVKDISTIFCLQILHI